MSGEPVTEILNRALGGDRAAHEDIYRLLYAELLKLARGQLSSADRLAESGGAGSRSVHAPPETRHGADA